MRYWVLVFVGVLLGCVFLQGCPALSGGNTFRLHNQLDRARVIDSLAITKTENEESSLDGVNILPTSLLPGNSFTVSNLPDGAYRITVRYECCPDATPGYRYRSISRVQFMEGGRSYDWYFNVGNQAKADKDIVVTEPVRGLWSLLGKYLNLP